MKKAPGKSIACTTFKNGMMMLMIMNLIYISLKFKYSLKENLVVPYIMHTEWAA